MGLSLRYLKLITSTTEIWISSHVLVFFQTSPPSVNGFIFHSLLKQKPDSSYHSLSLIPQIHPNDKTCYFYTKTYQ